MGGKGSTTIHQAISAEAAREQRLQAIGVAAEQTKQTEIAYRTAQVKLQTEMVIAASGVMKEYLILCQKFVELETTKAQYLANCLSTGAICLNRGDEARGNALIDKSLSAPAPLTQDQILQKIKTELKIPVDEFQKLITLGKEKGLIAN